MSGGEKLASIWSLYSPVKLLAHGGSSEVWLVHRKDDEQGPALALKMLSMTETHRAEFERERALMGRVQDKHVMKLVASHETPNHLVLITEFLAGGDLFDRATCKPGCTPLIRTERAVAAVAFQMLSAIAACHRVHIVHRDVKPENFVFETPSPESPLRLIDFGEAMLVEDDASYEEMTGTFHFCAPEVFDPPFTGATLFKTDVWSFGVSLFLLITGVPPFDGPHDHAVRKAARKGKYSWPDTVKPSASLVDLVAQCLQLNPALRPSTEQLLAHQWFADMVAAAQDEDYRDIVFSDATAESLLAFAASRQFQRALEKLLHSVQKHSATRRRTLSTETSPVRSRSSSSVDVSHAHHRQVSSSPNQSRRSSLLLPPTSGADEVWDDNSFKPRSRSTLVSTSPHSAALREAFEMFDSDRDGQLNAAEFNRLLFGGDAKTAARARAVMLECDSDGNGLISFDEFLDALLASAEQTFVASDVSDLSDSDSEDETSAIGSASSSTSLFDSMQVLLQGCIQKQPSPEFALIDENELPQPFRKLLVHDHNATPQLAEFYGCQQALNVLKVIESVSEESASNRTLTRLITLRCLPNEQFVTEIAFIRIHLHTLPENVQQLVCAGKLPFGTIMLENNVPQSFNVQCFFSLNPASALADVVTQVLHGNADARQSILDSMPPVSRALCTQSANVFGRCNIISHATTGDVICEVVELVPSP